MDPTFLDAVDEGLLRLQQRLGQMDRELRQARAEYRRLLELGELREGVAHRRLDGLTVLSRQERRVALLMANGHSNAEVASRLNVTVHTVKTQVGSILRKLELRSRWELTHVLQSGARAGGGGDASAPTPRLVGL